MTVGLGSSCCRPAFAYAGGASFQPWFRFLSPLIEPDLRVSRIRLSDWFHTQAHD